MTKSRRDLPISHLNEAQLVAYLDGELPRAQRDQARDHLESCWTCRGSLSEIQSSIEAFLDVRTALLPQASAFSESRVEQFRQRLVRHASASETEFDNLSVTSQAREWWTHAQSAITFLFQPRQAVIAGVLVAAMLVVMFTDVLNTRVSADTILARASQYETTHAPASGKVSRTEMRVDRIESSDQVATKSVKQLGTVTVVRDSATSEVYVQAQSISGASAQAVIKGDNDGKGDLLGVMLGADDAVLDQYLNSEHWIPELSADEFKHLGSRQGIAQSAVKQGDAFAVSYKYAPGASGIGEALLQVDVNDYAPTSISFIASSPEVRREYRLTRTAFSMETRTPAIAAMFAPSGGSGREELSARKNDAPALSKPVPLSYDGSRATAREVAITLALHKVDACLGEEINLFPMSDGSLLVQGLVDNGTRRETIAKALRQADNNVRVEIYLPREIKSGSDLYAPPELFAQKPAASAESDNVATLADLSNGQAPLAERLNQHFSQPGVSPEDANKQVAVYSSEVVTIARQTFLHAWALKRLDGEFSSVRAANLSAEQLRGVEQMRQDHRRWIATLAKRESDMLSIITPAKSAQDGPVAVGASSVDADTDTLLSLARTQNELVRALFADSRQAPAADANLSRLLAVVHRMGS
jgi:anti-sigma factor RsiW